jgi:hypothetical protein
MLIVAGLVLDGGQNYSIRREMQNAADSSAMAGAQALYKFQFQGGTASAVQSTALAAAGRNGNNSTFTCTVVQQDGKTPVAVSPPDCSNTSAVQAATAAGVAVKTKNTRNLNFGAFLGSTTQGVTATAAATSQNLAGGPAPFLICGAGAHNTGNNLHGYDILIPGSPYPTVDPNALSRYGNPLVYPSSTAPIPIQENTVPDCGAPGGSFDGKGDGSIANVGDTVAGQPGNGSNNHQAYQQVISAKPCDPEAATFNDCDLLIPIIDAAGGTGSHVTAHIVAWTVWHMTPGQGNTKFQGFLEAALINVGPTLTGQCTGAACVVKLRA